MIKGASLTCKGPVYLYAVVERSLAVQYGERVYVLDNRAPSIVSKDEEIIGIAATRVRIVKHGVGSTGRMSLLGISVVVVVVSDIVEGGWGVLR